MNFPSKLIEDAVSEFEKLPGIGRKTALRLVLHLLRQSNESVTLFSDRIQKMRSEIRFCKTCHNISDGEYCNICSSRVRNRTVVCVVENFRDVIAIENTAQYNGLYHVLGGVISPLEGIGPDALNIESLIQRTHAGEINEVLMALSPTMEGDTTIFYISRKLQNNTGIKITTLARGVAFGGELEYTDDLTLARSIATRLPYENYLVNRE
ncbi:MAG TPA: recombination protein RecR [Bacteroidetes bacterium]|nr:recombination protein RecR [Bacteroidota bacterium]